MILRFNKPEPPLDRFIQLLTYHKGFVASHQIERLIPDGSVVLVINLDESPKYIYDNEKLAPKQKCEKAWVSGMQKEYISISAGNNSEMLVVNFKPGGSYPFINLPLIELNDLVVDVEVIFGNEILYLRERLIECINPNDKFQIMTSWLSPLIRDTSIPAEVVDFTVDNIVINPSNGNLLSISEKTGYSQKQFIHLFKKHVGLTPKYFQRIVRFNKILFELENLCKIDWIALAIDCGYYDQAHFIKDFKYFSGENPERYLSIKGEYLNFIPIR